MDVCHVHPKSVNADQCSIPCRFVAAQQWPDLVVLSGDITQRAGPAQFRSAKALVDRLGVPALAIPGNHDIAPAPVGRSGRNRRLAALTPRAPNPVNILRWVEATNARFDQAQTGSEAGAYCRIECWDLARHDQVFVRTTVTPVQPERA